MPRSVADGYVAGRIRHARELCHLSQRALAARMGLSHGALQHYEAGRSPVPDCVLAEISIQCAQPVSFFFPAKVGA